MTIYYVDFENGNDATGDGSAGNPWKTQKDGPTEVRLAAGDEVRHAGKDVTSLGQSATWTFDSETVTLATAVNLEIATCEAAQAWTASANVTQSDDDDRKFLLKSQKLAINGSFGTGVVGYLDFAGSTDFSAYQQISFWAKASIANGTVGTGAYKVSLCTGTGGGTPVDDAAITFSPVADDWVRVVVDTAGALTGAALSVALIKTAGAAEAVDIYIDNVVACKASASADAITHRSVISPSSDLSKGAYRIGGIAGTTLTLAVARSKEAGHTAPYGGATETVATYKIESIISEMYTGTLTVTHFINFNSNSVTAWTEQSGGWTDLAGTPTQTGYSFYDFQNGRGSPYFYMTDITFSRFGLLDHYSVSQGSSSKARNKLKDIWICNAELDGLVCGGIGVILESIYVHGCGRYGITTNQGTGDFYFNGLTIYGCQGLGLYQNYQTRISGYNLKLNCNGKVGTGYGLLHYGGIMQIGGVSEVKNNPDEFALSYGAEVHFEDLTLGSGDLILANTQKYTKRPAITCQAYAGDYTDKRAWYSGLTSAGATCLSETTVRHTASGYAWKISSLQNTWNEYFPVGVSVATIACKASTAVTVNCWFRRTHVTNIEAKLICRGGQIAGVASDVEDAMTAAADTWEQLSITFTPTQTGVVEIEAHAWGGTTESVYVDDISFS